MSSLRQYLEKMEREQVVMLLRSYCDGQGELYADVALTICSLLAADDPQKPDVHEAFRAFCRQYLP